MNTSIETNGPANLLETLPSPEMSALKQRSRHRPFVGMSEDGKFQVVLRDYRIESLNADESLETASVQEIVAHLCEAHNDALDKMEEWSAAQCEALAKAAGIEEGFELPF